MKEFIEGEVKANDMVLFMKGTPNFPQCGFSGQVIQILDYLGTCLLYTSPSPRDLSTSRMPSSA